MKNSKELSIEEIGDGNINYVYRIRDERNQTVILKVATGTLRSSGRDLTTDRIRLEAEYLRYAGKVDSDRIPVIYDFDEEQHAVVMQDIGHCKNLRYALEDEVETPGLSKQLGVFCARMAYTYSDFALTPAEKKELDVFFVNPEMCDISEDLVFTEPYNDYKGRNRIHPENQTLIELLNYGDEIFQARAAALRFEFMNRHEALLHGDLHSGSIFVAPEGCKIIDSEFAFFGPIAYDTGNVLAHFVIAYAAKRAASCENEGFLKYLSDCVTELMPAFRTEFRRLTRERRVTLHNTAYVEAFLDRVDEETIAYAGMEIVRRTIGDTKTREIERFEDKPEFQSKLFRLGREMVLASATGLRAETVIDLIEQYMR